MPTSEKLTIDTPEQTPLDFALAGVGSRFLALAFDTLLQGSAIAAVAILTFFGQIGVTWMVRGTSLSPWLFAAGLAMVFVIYSGYFALFESLWGGQTPGKRLVGLRVIDVSGRPLTVYPAIIRNLIRLVDQLPGIYAIGILSVLLTRRQQRLGDLAAGTVVIHERLDAVAPVVRVDGAALRHGAHRLTADEIVLVEGFLRRRGELEDYVRLTSARHIARRMAGRLGIAAVTDEERFLEELVAEYRSDARYR